MASVIERVRKRQKLPVDIGGGDSVYVRGLKFPETEELKSVVEQTEGNGAIVGFGLLNDDGTQAVIRNETETITEFGARVLTQLDMEISVCLLIVEKIIEATKTVANRESLIKN